MRGILQKTSNEWFVKHNEKAYNYVWETKFQLHPDDALYSLDADEGTEVEFKITEECPHYNGSHTGKDCSCKEGFIKYAKLIPRLDRTKFKGSAAQDTTPAITKNIQSTMKTMIEEIEEQATNMLRQMESMTERIEGMNKKMNEVLEALKGS